MGTLRQFDSEEGWGVIDTPSTPGGCWVHFSAINVSGYRSLGTGDTVVVDVEAGEQDGFAYRATDVWPEGIEPDTRPEPPTDVSGAYRSRLVITDDDDALVFDSDADSPPDASGRDVR